MTSRTGTLGTTLYQLASGSNYGTYFYDVTTGNHQANPSVPVIRRPPGGIR
jgi:hypothetical protein